MEAGAPNMEAGAPGAGGALHQESGALLTPNRPAAYQPWLRSLTSLTLCCHISLLSLLKHVGKCQTNLYPSNQHITRTRKKAEHQRIYTFELWCWRKLLRVSWTVWRSSQSILKETSSEYSLEGLMLKLKVQCFGQLTRRIDSFEKTLIVGKIEGRGEGNNR